MQSLNKYKTVYIATICGLLSNAILDIPLMYLLKFIGLPAYIGPLVSSIIGYMLSVFINLIVIKKEEKQINYKDSLKTIVKILVPSLSMFAIILVLKNIIPFNATSRLSAVLIIIFYAIIGVLIYGGIAYKMGLLDEVLGKNLLNKITKKLKRQA